MALVDRQFVAPLIHRRAWIFALFLGLSLAVAATARVECEPAPLTGGGSWLTGGSGVLTGGRQCEIQAGGYRYRLPWPLSSGRPAWVHAVLSATALQYVVVTLSQHISVEA